jgi:hypothetical protein
MQNDGNFVIYGPNNRNSFWQATNSNQSGMGNYVASLADNGAFTINAGTPAAPGSPVKRRWSRPTPTWTRSRFLQTARMSSTFLARWLKVRSPSIGRARRLTRAARRRLLMVREFMTASERPISQPSLFVSPDALRPWNIPPTPAVAEPSSALLLPMFVLVTALAARFCLMRRAREQAEGYAAAARRVHRWPPEVRLGA